MVDDKETVFLSKELMEMMSGVDISARPKRQAINEIIIEGNEFPIKFLEISITDLIVELDFICRDEDFDLVILSVGKNIKIPSMMKLGVCMISSIKITNDLRVKVVAIRE